MGKACWIALVYGMESSQAHPTPQGHSGEYKDDLMAPKTLHRARFAPEAAYGAFASELITCTTDAIVSKRVPSYGSNHCMLSSRTSSILYAPLQVCIQHMHILDDDFISSKGAYMPFLIPSQSFFVYTISCLPMQNMQHFRTIPKNR